MKFKIAICDDEQNQIDYMASIVASWSAHTGHNCEIRTFASAEAFLFEYEEDKAFDILLLDIEMENMNGIELAKRIRKDHNRAEIIFITSHFEFVWEGYEVDALHYLTKPLSAEKLTQVLSKAADKLSVEPPSVVISCDGETLKLYESDILYAEAFLHYIVIHTKDNEYKIKEPISVFENKVSDDFYRIHRSYLVSLKYITRISRTSVTIGNSTLPLSRGKYDDINRAFIEHNRESRKLMRKKTYLKLVDYQTEQSEKHLNEVRSIHKEMRGYKHDFHHHLQTLKGQLEAGEIERALAYIEQLDTQLMQVDTLLKTGNVSLDAILSAKIAQAKAEAITVTVKANVPDILTISDLELSIVIGNLLDNAIESCRTVTGERFIRIFISMKGTMLYFSMLNTAGPKKKKTGSLFVTHKDGVHGFGLRRAEAILEEHGGWVKYNSEDGAFTSEFLVPAIE